MVDPNLMTPEQKAKLKYSDDGRNYIFPADEVAPGANFGPKTSPVTMPVVPEIVPSTGREIAGEAQNDSSQELVPSIIQTQEKPATAAGFNISPSLKTGLTQEANALSRQATEEAKLKSKEVEAYDQEAERNRLVKERYDNLYRENVTKRDELEANAPKMEHHNIFAGKATWQKIIGGIGMFLGSITPEGARNVAGFIDRTIEADRKMQEANINLYGKKINTANNLLAKLRENYKDDVLANAQFRLTALGKIKSQIERTALNATSVTAQAAMKKAVGEVEQAQIKDRAVFENRLAEKAAKDEKPTDAQSISAGYAVRAEQAERAITELGSKGFKGSEKIRVFTGNLPNFAKPEDEQIFAQAKDNFITAVLRKESGANIPDSERVVEERKYFPMPGDSDAVIKKKEQARKTAIQGLKVGSGSQYDKVKNSLMPSVAGFKPK